MKAARIVGPRRFEVLDVDSPTAAQGEALLRIDKLSICGSDLRAYERVLPEEDYPDPLGQPCHECSGIVEESLSPDLKPGQRVISLAYSGGLVEFSAVPTSLVVPVPYDFDAVKAVLCQPLGTAIYSLQRAGSVLGKNVVVLGQGPIGLMFSDLLLRQGASQVIVTDVVENRLETARSLGVSAALNPATEDVEAGISDLTGGQLADLVIEACGLPETNNQAFRLLRKEGTVLIFGMPRRPDPIAFDWTAMYDKLPTIMVTNSRRSNDVVESVGAAVDLVSRGAIDLSYLVSHDFQLEEIGAAFELFSRRTDDVLKVMVSV